MVFSDRTVNVFLLVSLVLVFGGLASANHYDFPDRGVTYNGGDITVSIGCDSSAGQCPDAYSDYYQLEVCGERAARKRGSFGATSPTDEYTFSFSVPQNAACSMSDDNEFTFVPEPNNRDSSTQHVGSGGSLTVYSDNMQEHFGEHIAVGIHVGDPHLQYFQLTNDEDFDSGHYKSNDAGSTAQLMIMAKTNELVGNTYKDDFNIGGKIMQPGDSLMDLYSEPDPNTVSLATPCSNGNDKICDAAQLNSGSSVNLELNLFNPSSISSLNDNLEGFYWPDGEIVSAQFPKYYVPQRMDGSVSEGSYSEEFKIFVCREGAEMTNELDGTTQYETPMVVNTTYQGLAKCDTSTGEWDTSVTVCSDGLDNDGDGKIDTSDPGCNSDTDTSEEGTAPTCETGVTRATVRQTTLGINYPGIVAQYETTDGCSTDGTINSDDDIVASNLDEDPIYTECAESYPYFGGICTQKSWDYGGFGHDVMPVVQYWPTWNYFYQMENADENLDLSEDVYETDFVSDYRGWTPKVQSLHEAEEKYSGDTVPPNYCGTGGECQDYSMWENRIREPDVSTAYDNEDSSTNIEAWYHGDEAGPYNAGVNVSAYTSQREVLSKDTSEEAIFKGGFAGKCESDQVWQKTQDTGNTWRCSGEIPWQQTVYLPEFQNNDNAGLIFPPYNFMNSQSDLPDYIFEQNPSSGRQLGAGWNSFETAAEQMDFLFTDSDVDHIDARCWEGNSNIDVDNPPSDVAVTDWFEISVPSNPSDPVSNFRPLDHGGTYSCYWEITTAGGETVADIQDKMVEIHKHLGSNPSNKDEIAVKNMTEDSSYADDLPDMTGSDHEMTASELTEKIGSWN